MFGFEKFLSANFTNAAARELRFCLGGAADLKSRGVRTAGGAVCELFWLDALADETLLSEEILRPLSALKTRSGAETVNAALQGGVWRGDAALRRDAAAAAEDLLAGAAVLTAAGTGEILAFLIRSAAVRGVEQPTVEKSVLGPKESFTETLSVNTALLRRRLPSPRLRVRALTLGREAPVRSALVYLDGAAQPDRVAAVLARLEAADPAFFTSAGQLERPLAGRPRGLFPQVLHTERPDRFAAELIRGKVGVLTEGLPVGFLTPCALPELLLSQEDGARHVLVAAGLVTLRCAALLLALLLPGAYVAAAVHHPEMIPCKLLLSVMQAKEQVPFSTAAEVLGMLFSFELLQEAGIRLPEPVGQTVSIIGALIVGQSAVEARVLSPIVIIVVAVSGIAGYVLPSQELNAAVRLWRGVLVILAAALGLFGVLCGVMALLRRLCRTENLGQSCLFPLCDGAPGALRRFFRALTGKARP